MPTNTDTWHNTGGNGPASAVWVRKQGTYTSQIEVMPHRCLVTLYVEGELDEDYEGIPFPTLAKAQHWADSLMARLDKLLTDKRDRDAETFLTEC